MSNTVSFYIYPRRRVLKSPVLGCISPISLAVHIFLNIPWTGTDTYCHDQIFFCFLERKLFLTSERILPNECYNNYSFLSRRHYFTKTVLFQTNGQYFYSCSQKNKITYYDLIFMLLWFDRGWCQPPCFQNGTNLKQFTKVSVLSHTKNKERKKEI